MLRPSMYLDWERERDFKVRYSEVYCRKWVRKRENMRVRECVQREREWERCVRETERELIQSVSLCWQLIVLPCARVRVQRERKRERERRWEGGNSLKYDLRSGRERGERMREGEREKVCGRKISCSLIVIIPFPLRALDGTFERHLSKKIGWWWNIGARPIIQLNITKFKYYIG